MGHSSFLVAAGSGAASAGVFLTPRSSSTGVQVIWERGERCTDQGPGGDAKDSESDDCPGWGGAEDNGTGVQAIIVSSSQPSGGRK
mmetsp:Transcript_63114/g.142348  ORF Transcript_63114/g.142348 Transcript_63114/m.142348 type:complete len:86 (-) Transcript_63114:246-503(-)